jgi:hypothetical protein
VIVLRLFHLVCILYWVVLTCFVMRECFDSCVRVLVICVLVFTVFCIVYTVFVVLFRLCIFIISFACTSVRTTATE